MTIVYSISLIGTNIPLIFFFFQRIKALLHNDKITQTDMLRLVMLYALRYESHSNNDVSGLVDTLRKKGVNDKHRAVSFFCCL